MMIEIMFSLPGWDVQILVTSDPPLCLLHNFYVLSGLEDFNVCRDLPAEGPQYL